MPISGSPNIRRDPPEGDMMRSVYDTDEDGKVDDSEKLEANTKAQVQDHDPKGHNHSVIFSICIPIDTPETTGSDKGTFAFAPAFAGIITEVYIMAKIAPGSGKTLTVDVNKNGTSIFTNQANRPSLSGTSTVDTSGTPGVTSYAKNDKFSVDVDISTAGSAVADVIALIRGIQTAS